MEARGFTPPDLTHPLELLQAGAWALQGGAWLLSAFIALGAVLAVAAWATRREVGPVDGTLLAYSRLAGWLPQAALGMAMVIAAVGVCGTLANRAHYDEQRVRSQALGSFPDGKISQGLPIFGHIDTITEHVERQVDGKTILVAHERQEERHHYVTSSQVQAKILRKPDPVHEGRDRFDVTFVGSYGIANPLGKDERFFLDLPGPSNVALVHDLKVEADGKALAPDSEGGIRYWLPLPANGKAQVVYQYEAEGVPRWVYETGGARVSAFNLSIETDVPHVKFASGIAPSKTENSPIGQKLIWAYPGNAAFSEPVGIFTAIATATLGPAELLPRWLLLAPGLLALWLGVLCFVCRTGARQMLVTGALFGAAVFFTAALGKLIPPVAAWAIVSIGLLFLSGRLARPATPARLATLFGLVLPGAALALGHAGLGLACALSLLAAWLAWAADLPEDQGAKI